MIGTNHILQMNYKIFLDSNQLFNQNGPLDEPFNLDIPEIRKFLKANEVKNVEICLPEIVIKERIQQKLENIYEHLETVNETSKRLNAIGHSIPAVKKNENYQKLLEKKCRDFFA